MILLIMIHLSQVGQVPLSGDRITLGVPQQCIQGGRGLAGGETPLPGSHVPTTNLNLICI
jgi:hypothetical protein